MLKNRSLLEGKKNLLAFSAGGDSTALLFMLLEHQISFDIAIVDYSLRKESKAEVKYAKELAQTHGFHCYVHLAEQISQNFEANARQIRYEFFESLIQEHNYENLLTAHHLGDRFEWMLMQFCKGAGCYELAGMRGVEQREHYSILRPLLHLDKEELLNYLQTNNIKYFDDASNADEKYLRNRFRHHYTKPLLKEYKSGIAKSFEYLDSDAQELVEQADIGVCNELAYFKPLRNTRSNIAAIDKYIKSKGSVITAQERGLLGQESCVVLGRKYAVWQMSELIIIAPYYANKDAREAMPKSFKEKMRKMKIDPKLRGYLATDSEAVALLSTLL